MPDDYEDLVSKASLVRNKVDWVQVDVMDGKYTSSVSWPYEHNEHFSKILNQDEGLPFWEDLNYEIDLMVESPDEKVEDWIDAGAARIILHLKTLHNIDISDLVHHIKSLGVEVGIAVLPGEDYSSIEEEMDNLDFVQFMGIKNVGFQNQEFAGEILDQIREFHEKYPSKIISIDGGVDLDTAKDLVDAGADRLVSGSFIFEGSPEDNINEIKKVLM